MLSSKTYKIDLSEPTLLSLFIIISFMAGIYIFGFDLIEGDPTVYFPFFPHMFDAPFSFGQEGRISFGATSPFVAVLMASIFHISENEYQFLMFYKVFLLGVLLIFFYLMVLCIDLMEGQKRTNYKKVIALLLIVFSSISSLYYHTVFVFETPVVLLYSGLLFYLFLKKEYVKLLLVSPLAYLIRPEVVLLQATLGLYAIYQLYKQGKPNLCVSMMLIQFAPLVCYHWYMYEHTGRLIPTSIESRISRSDHLIGLRSYAYGLIQSYHFYIGFFFVSLLSLVATIRPTDNKNEIAHLWVLKSAICFPIVMFCFSPTLPIRYFDFLMPIIMVFSAHILNKTDISRETIRKLVIHKHLQLGSTKLSASLLLCFLVASITVEYFISNEMVTDKLALPLRMLSYTGVIFSSIYCAFINKMYRFFWFSLLGIYSMTHITAFGPYSLDSHLNNRLDMNFGEQINSMLDQDDTLLMYEIELQYFVDRRVLSMDGIVGNGEFLDFYKGDESFQNAVLRNSVDFVGIDHFGMAPPMMNSKTMKLLFDNYEEMKIGDSIIVDKFKFIKVLENNSDTKYPMWHTIFKIDYR